MINRDHPAFKKEAKPFYDITMKGLIGEVDGEHFWDAVAVDAVFDFMYEFPGFPFIPYLRSICRFPIVKVKDLIQRRISFNEVPQTNKSDVFRHLIAR